MKESEKTNKKKLIGCINKCRNVGSTWLILSIIFNVMTNSLTKRMDNIVNIPVLEEKMDVTTI